MTRAKFTCRIIARSKAGSYRPWLFTAAPPGRKTVHTFLTVCLLLAALPARADDSLAQTVGDVNKKMVKLFGSGGFKGLASYGTGLLVSPKGHILTVATPMLDTQDLRVHLYDGRRLHAKVLVVEPLLDAALVKIDDDKLDDLPYFDIAQAA